MSSTYRGLISFIGILVIVAGIILYQPWLILLGILILLIGLVIELLDPTLIAVGGGGFCNRHRVLVSAAVYHQHTKQPVEIIIFNDCLDNYQWSDLFVTNLPIKNYYYTNPLDMFESVIQMGLVRLLSPELIQKKVFNDYDINNQLYLSEVRNLYPATKIINTWWNFKHQSQSLTEYYTVRDDIIRNWKYHPELEAMLVPYTREICVFNQDIIGVHVRTTDILNTQITKYISLDDYSAAMDKYPSNVKFFIASDSDARDKLAARFPGRVLTQQTTVQRRTSATNIRVALVDLICLANCKHIIGFWGSTFSDEAKDWPAIDGHSKTIEYLKPEFIKGTHHFYDH